MLSSATVCWANAKGFAMARRCELTGTGAQGGNKVSHSNRKSKRRFMVNLVNVTLISDSLERSVRLRISAHALKSVDHRGGLDAFLAKASDDELSPKALDIKRQVAKKRIEAVAGYALVIAGLDPAIHPHHQTFLLCWITGSRALRSPVMTFEYLALATTRPAA